VPLSRVNVAHHDHWQQAMNSLKSSTMSSMYVFHSFMSLFYHESRGPNILSSIGTTSSIPNRRIPA
jgi:hypothetical protein